jgi:tetratricopeptide (TPR) repeat protein
VGRVKTVFGRGRSAAVLLLASAIALGAVPARADDAPERSPEQLREARTRFQRGIELYEEGDMDAALVELRRAYEIAPSYKLLFNIGQVQLQKSDYASALDSFERYLAGGGDKISKKRRSELEPLVQKLRQRVAEVTVTVDVAGAEVLVDDLPRGTAPLSEPLVVNAGRRKISAQAPGRTPAVKQIEAAGAERLTVALELLPETVDAPPPAVAPLAPVERPPLARKKPLARPPQPAPASRPADKPFPWAAWTATGVLATGAIVVGALAYDASRDLEKKREQQGVSRDDLDDALERTEKLALLADITGGAAVLTGALSMYLTLSGGPARTEGSNSAKHGWIGVTANGSF